MLFTKYISRIFYKIESINIFTNLKYILHTTFDIEGKKFAVTLTTRFSTSFVNLVHICKQTADLSLSFIAGPNLQNATGFESCRIV